jgi:hypothetical protein
VSVKVAGFTPYIQEIYVDGELEKLGLFGFKHVSGKYD